jgi:hypothetical protein
MVTRAEAQDKEKGPWSLTDEPVQSKIPSGFRCDTRTQFLPNVSESGVTLLDVLRSSLELTLFRFALRLLTHEPSCIEPEWDFDPRRQHPKMVLIRSINDTRLSGVDLEGLALRPNEFVLDPL